MFKTLEDAEKRIDELSEYLLIIREIAKRNPKDVFCQTIIEKAEEALQESFDFKEKTRLGMTDEKTNS